MIIEEYMTIPTRTGGIMANNWPGRSYNNRHFVRATGPKLTKAQREDAPTKFHYPGALVGNPTLNDFPHVIHNVIDMDYEAMYPTMIMVNNLFPDTIKYKLWVDPRQFTSGACINNGIGANHDPDDVQSDYSDAIIGDYITGNLLAFMHTWFAVPDIDQVYASIMRDRENAQQTGGSLW